MSSIAIVGGGPAGLTCAIALARRGIPSTVFEREGHPETTRRFHPDRSHPIDITGHGLRALRHIDAVGHFEAQMTTFRGIKYKNRVVDPWSEPGWIGSRGDIMRALMSVIDERHRNMIEVDFQTAIDTLNMTTGEVMGRHFDLIIGADGAGSKVRAAMQDQVPGFTVQTSMNANQGLILELDQVQGQFDKHYLNGLAISPFSLAGAITDESKPDGVRWVAVLGTKYPIAFGSPMSARRWLQRFVPRALEAASDQAITDFSHRRCISLGRRLTCSSLSAGKAVLIGDAAAVFPPIGQGCNAALESAMVLDQCLAASSQESVGPRYNAAWKPEADALTWIGWQMRYQDPGTVARALAGAALGVNLARMTKSSNLSYADVRRAARRLGPLTVKDRS
jgi:kynurenine 3-monooxygenase